VEQLLLRGVEPVAVGEHLLVDDALGFARHPARALARRDGPVGRGPRDEPEGVHLGEPLALLGPHVAHAQGLVQHQEALPGGLQLAQVRLVARQQEVPGLAGRPVADGHQLLGEHHLVEVLLDERLVAVQGGAQHGERQASQQQGHECHREDAHDESAHASSPLGPRRVTAPDG
jgi:hypothetical protein